MSSSSYYVDSADGRSMVLNASLHPPIDAVAAASMMPSVLLDLRAYIDRRTNATTAHSKTRAGHAISVTFWPARPPRASCFSVHCPGLNPGDFAEEPVVMATQDDLVLLCIILGTWPITRQDRLEYFVYQAGGSGSGTGPSLEPLQRPGPSCNFHIRNVGLMRRHTPNLDDSKDDGFYIVAALCYSEAMVPGHYDLYTYDSRTKEWATKTAFLRREHELGHHSSHLCSKVIVVGGEAGTMGWVDFRKGILFCDVLLQDQDQDQDRTVPVPLCYIALPEPFNPDRELPRDIAVVKGCIKYVEHRTHVRPGSIAKGNFIADDWTAAMWSRKAAATKSLEKGSWQPICKVSASHISAAKKKKSSAQQYFELLPKLLDDQGNPQPTLERLHTGHPMLSLHQDNVVYFMAKIHYQTGEKAWVLAVDTKKKTLQGVAQVDVRKAIGMKFSYMCRTSHGHLKRPHMSMWQSSLKKQAGTAQLDSLVWDGGQNHQDSEVEGTSARSPDHEDMDLE